MSNKHCFHCDLPIYSDTKWYAVIDGIGQPMCCPGCKAVAEVINAGGLTSYYHNRTQKVDTATNLNAKLVSELELYDRSDIQKTFVSSNSSRNSQQLTANLLIQGITCGSCIWLLENHLQAIPGISQVYINLSSHKAQITWHSDKVKLSKIMQAVYSIGYKCKPWENNHKYNIYQQQKRSLISKLAVATIATMQVMMYAIATYFGDASHDLSPKFLTIFHYTSVLFTTPVVFYSATPFFISAWRALKNQHLNMDVPVSLAITIAYFASLYTVFFTPKLIDTTVYFDSICMFVVFLLTGRFLEMRAYHFIYKSSQVLDDLIPKSCLCWKNGKFVRIYIQDIKVDDLIRVLPGEIIPADGILIKGQANINEAVISGESIPITKQIGEQLFCASINTEQPIEMRVQQLVEKSKISLALNLASQAQQQKPKINILADKISSYFTITLLLIASSVFCYWSIYSANALWITLSVLVVTCPCALSLATPVAMTAATANLNRLGLLITKNNVLENLNLIDTIVFDKTGTLTEGKINLQEIKVINSKVKASNCLDIAIALEECFNHPLAKAFKRHKPQNKLLVVKNRHNFIGKGIVGEINGTKYKLGLPSFASSHSDEKLPSDKGQWILLSADNQPVCWFNFSDTIRPEATNVVKTLYKMQKNIIILSGDHKTTVTEVAKTLGIKQFHAQVTPENKLKFVQQLQKQQKRVLMIGDGINDVPVLSGSDISIAMGSVANLNTNNADAILIVNNLSIIINAIYLAKKSYKTIKQNFIWAICYNLLAVPPAIMGMLAPWMAAIGMTLSSLIVITNSLKLIKKKFPLLTGE